MQPLEPPDSFFVSAAEGWLGLGDLPAAAMELDQVAENLRQHPAVLDVRWAICAQKADWTAAVEIARALLQSEPAEVAGWLHHAYALRRAPEGGLEAAWTVLLPALDCFPENTTVPYNLACYACQMQRLDEARQLLQRAARKAEGFIKQLALTDEDLEPLWPEIRRWKG